MFLAFVPSTIEDKPVLSYAVVEPLESTCRARELGFISFVGMDIMMKPLECEEYIRDGVQEIVSKFSDIDAVAIADPDSPNSDDKWRIRFYLIKVLQDIINEAGFRVVSFISESWKEKLQHKDKYDCGFTNLPQCMKDAYMFGVYYYERDYR